MSGELPLVVAVVGTDHHPFDRLVRSVDEWAAGGKARVLIQYGTSAAPSRAEGRDLIPVDELGELLRAASVVVCHGGPGTIASAREAGKVPLVVPRRPELGEHVDEHQVLFVSRLSAEGRVLAAEEGLQAALDAALADPPVCEPGGPDAADATASFAGMVGSLLGPAQGGVRVLYVAGWGRSGSTLLDRLLGQVPGVFSTGEVRDIWQRGVMQNRLCGCGAAFHDCEVWRRVGEVAFGGWSELDVGDAHELRLRLDRPWSPPRVLGSRLTPELDADVERYVGYLERLYGAIAEVTGARVIVDSSKIATYAMLLHRVPGMDLRALHLVRDPRGVVHSWQKTVVRADAGGRDEMLRYGVAPASARYVFYNSLAHGLAALGIPYRRLRYEDLIAAPREHVARTLAFAGLASPAGTLDFIGDGRAELGANHTVDGNPMRLQMGEVALLADTAWRTDMEPGRRSLVSALTAPLLVAYGYPVRG